MRYVVLAANHHPDYEFLMPITGRLWNLRTSYSPLYIESSCNDRMGVKLARWCVASSDARLKDDDEVLLQDVDIWPIDGAFWDRDFGTPVTCFYGDAFQWRRHATSGFRAKVWALREITHGKGWVERLNELRLLPEDDERRHSDDAAQSDLVLDWMKAHPRDYTLVERGPSPPRNRIDRSAWPGVFDLAGKVDAHLPRDASDRRVWLQILPLFDMLAPSRREWVRDYRNEWERI